MICTAEAEISSAELATCDDESLISPMTRRCVSIVDTSVRERSPISSLRFMSSCGVFRSPFASCSSAVPNPRNGVVIRPAITNPAMNAPSTPAATTAVKMRRCPSYSTAA